MLSPILADVSAFSNFIFSPFFVQWFYAAFCTPRLYRVSHTNSFIYEFSRTQIIQANFYHVDFMRDFRLIIIVQRFYLLKRWWKVWRCFFRKKLCSLHAMIILSIAFVFSRAILFENYSILPNWHTRMVFNIHLHDITLSEWLKWFLDIPEIAQESSGKVEDLTILWKVRKNSSRKCLDDNSRMDFASLI